MLAVFVLPPQAFTRCHSQHRCIGHQTSSGYSTRVSFTFAIKKPEHAHALSIGHGCSAEIRADHLLRPSAQQVPMDDINYRYCSPRQTYSQTQFEAGFPQRRSSSSASVPLSQPFDTQNFQPQLESYELSSHYGFDQSSEWAGNSVNADSLSTINASNFSPTDISEYTRPAQDPSWDPIGRSKARGVDNNLQPFITTSASHVGKANTIAGPVRSNDVFKRPNFQARQSFISVPDSGYGSQPTTIDGIISSSQAEAKGTDVVSVDTCPPIQRAPPPPASVKTEPSGVKRRRSKSFAQTCHCGRELKNRSEAV